MSFRDQLLRKQQERKISWNVIELDYALSWILAAIGEYAPAKQNLIFKGGTCLKKCYFGERYRFSEDLDFTTDPQITGSVLDHYLAQIVMLATKLSAQKGSGIEYSAALYQEKKAHPFNQRAYIVKAQFPWHRSPLTRIKLEISRDEDLSYAPVEKPILHEYGETLPQTITTYALEEILTEKYRGILQNQERLKHKGWMRSRVRDFYDLWYMLKHFKHEINFEGFTQAFDQKCLQKGITFEGAQQFFNQKEYLGKVEKDWGQFLNGLITTALSFEKTIEELKAITEEIFEK
jgi:predicted nucleotidyltransferase component of viral defense system